MDSLIHKIAKAPGAYTFPPDSKPLFALYRSLYELTDGTMTPLIGQALADAGYDATYSLQPTKLHHPPAWDAVMAFSYPLLTTKEPVLLDIGAAGKGYLVDIVADLLKEAAIAEFCIDAGGDIVVNRPKVTLSIGLEHPGNPSQIIGIATLHNQAICGSAGNRRSWGKYHHIINPSTLESPQHIQATWVVADTALVADGLATALFFTEPARLQHQFAFSYAIVYADNSLTYSANFPAKWFAAPEQ
jgi:thiamine biosynthesis lipoprotein